MLLRYVKGSSGFMREMKMESIVGQSTIDKAYSPRKSKSSLLSLIRVLRMDSLPIKFCLLDH